MSAIDCLMDCRHLLLLPPNWIGDAVMAQPAMRALALHLQTLGGERELTLSGRGWLADLLPFLDLPEARFEKKIPSDADTGILFPNSFGSAWRLRRAGVKRRIGFAGQWRRLLLTDALAPNRDMKVEHHRLYFLDLAAQCGAPAAETSVRLSLPEEESMAGRLALFQHGLNPDRTICIAPGAQYGGAKRYPAERYAAINRQLAQHGYHLLLLGTPAEREIASQTLTGIETPHWNGAGETSMRQALQMLAASRLLLCNDSGLMHVAAGMGKPVVALFGATAPGRTSPSAARELPQPELIYRPAPCSPCLARECKVAGQPCMANIAPELVVQTVLKKLDA